jgi:hypothetical protein
MFLVKAGRTEATTAAYDWAFVVMPLVYMSLKQLWQGRGIVGALLGLTGTELLHRTWIAVRSSSTSAGRTAKVAEWAAVMDIFVLESVFEGLPLVLLALMYSLQVTGRPCQLVSCDLEPYHTVLPQWALSAAPTPPSMTLDYSAALQADGCAYLPFTSDGWFSMRVSSTLARDGFSYSVQDVRRMGPSGRLMPFNFIGTSRVPGL